MKPPQARPPAGMNWSSSAEVNGFILTEDLAFTLLWGQIPRGTEHLQLLVKAHLHFITCLPHLFFGLTH